MGIVDLFSKRQAQADDSIWERYEQAQQPEQHPLPTGQTISEEDYDTSVSDPWNLYYTYMESVAIPQIEETQKTLKNLNQSIPAEMLPEPGDPIDLPKLYPETIQSLGTIKDFLTSHLPSSGREVDEFMDKSREKSTKDRDKQVLDQIEREGYPSELEREKNKSRMTRRTGPDSAADEEIDPTEYSSRRLSRMSAVQLFASRR